MRNTWIIATLALGLSSMAFAILPGDVTNAEECRETGGLPQFSGKSFNGCVWTQNLPGGHLDVPKDCRIVKDSQGEHEECECPACGHGESSSQPAPEPEQHESSAGPQNQI